MSPSIAQHHLIHLEGERYRIFQGKFIDAQLPFSPPVTLCFPLPLLPLEVDPL